MRIETIMIESLLEPFYQKLSKCEKRQLQCGEEGQIELVLIDKDFRNQSQLLFEMIQMMLKPLVNALMQDQRKDVTE